MDKFRRRQLLFATAIALAVPRLLFAQQPPRIQRLGLLFSPSLPSDHMAEFVRVLRELGYFEGKNIAIESRFADGKYERLPGLAAELLGLSVDIIVATGAPAVKAAQRATTVVPIVMTNVGDPVGLGFVASLSRPGGNITGISNVRGDTTGKSLEFLLALVPRLSRVAVLLNPASPSSSSYLKQVQAGARTAGVSISAFEASTTEQIDSAFASIVRARPGALILAAEPFLNDHARQVAALAAKHRIPVMYPYRMHVEAGGLMSYGTNAFEIFRQAAVYVDKILKGAKPATLPVEQPTKFELVINRKTAKALGLSIPQELLLRADRVIE